MIAKIGVKPFSSVTRFWITVAVGVKSVNRPTASSRIASRGSSRAATTRESKMPQTDIVWDKARRSQEAYTLLERAIETEIKKPTELVKKIDELNSAHEATKSIIHDL